MLEESFFFPFNWSKPNTLMWYSYNARKLKVLDVRPAELKMRAAQ